MATRIPGRVNAAKQANAEPGSLPGSVRSRMASQKIPDSRAAALRRVAASGNAGVAPHAIDTFCHFVIPALKQHMRCFRSPARCASACAASGDLSRPIIHSCSRLDGSPPVPSGLLTQTLGAGMTVLLAAALNLIACSILRPETSRSKLCNGRLACWGVRCG